MLLAHLLPFIRNLSQRKTWSDDDVVEDIDYLKTTLGEAFESLTTWDEYANEVKVGKLEWSPVHESEAFWKESVGKFNEGEYATLK